MVVFLRVQGYFSLTFWLSRKVYEMNWSVYNDSLVMKDEILLDFSALEG